MTLCQSVCVCIWLNHVLNSELNLSHADEKYGHIFFFFVRRSGVFELFLSGTFIRIVFARLIYIDMYIFYILLFDPAG